MGCFYIIKKKSESQERWKEEKSERISSLFLLKKIEKSKKIQMDRRNPGKKVVILMMMHNAMVFTYYITLFLVCL